MTRSAFLGLFCVCAVTSVQAATFNVTCSGSVAGALQTAINSAHDGDTVQIGAGSCTASGSVSWTDKNITVIGAGKGVTNITANSGLFIINSTTAKQPNWRVSGFTVTGTTSAVAIQAWADKSAQMQGPFRIDNIAVNYPNSSADGMLQFWGTIYGLIDHSDLTMAGEAAILTGLSIDGEVCSYNYAWEGGTCSLSTLAGGAATAIPYSVGGTKNIYIEDSTFTGLSSNGMSPIDTGYSGARIVFRHNTVTNGFLYGHWTSAGNVNTLWWEVYGNTFNWTMGSGSGIYPARLQGGGTGLIYNNTVTGYPSNYILIGEGRNPSEGQSSAPLNFCDGTQSVDGNAGDPAAPGWPCLSQTGRNAGVSISQITSGTKQGSFPMYLWHNGPESTCINQGGACSNTFTVNVVSGQNAYFKNTAHPNGDIDWGVSSTQPSGLGTHVLTYTPFTYPYPLTDAGLPDPSGSGGGGQAPAASFACTPTSGNAPLAVTCTDRSTNTPTSWAWAFGDGGTSTSQNPAYTYNAAGTYTVMLTATNGTGSDGATPSTITVSNNSADTTPPTTPTNLVATPASTTAINLSWTASTDNVGVTGYYVRRGGNLIATVTGTTYANTGLTPSTTYTYTVTATDAAGNVSSASTAATATTNAPPVPATTLFAPGDVPTTPADADANSVELGMKFQVSSVGQITGVRFYKGTTNVGTHTGTLWTSTGTQLARVTFTGESSSGWQQASFAAPVNVSANTTYVVSYHTAGHYAADQNYFASGKTNAPLSAPANAGVYLYGSSPVFPTQVWNATNYWVDVVYAPTTGSPMLLLSAHATRGQAFTYTVVATNTPTGYAAVGLPAGLSLNTTTGVISGVPNVTGTSDVSLTASNGAGSDMGTLRITVQ